ncbi:MAG: sulfite exporter TauE/SafE family protein [Microthrixaceae bacterium]|nr:sulfite exporter TauE/SafE family protein [Microthrixaceae bacterium]
MESLLVFLFTGFAAQLINGSLGMGFGVVGSTVLIAGGASVASASTAVHVAKLGASVVSTGAHWRFGNVNWRTVWLMGIPGMLGGFVGASVLSRVDGESMVPVASVILLVLGLVMLSRFAFGATPTRAAPGSIPRTLLVPVGLLGGVIDSIGGGGWGPVATPTLMGVGRMDPRLTIGSVSAAEFFVALGATLGFVLNAPSLGIGWTRLAALVLGAALAAPVAAWAVKVLPLRVLGTLVGALIVLLNLNRVLAALGAPSSLTTAVTLAGLAAAVLLVTRTWSLERSGTRLLRSAALPRGDGQGRGSQGREYTSMVSRSYDENTSSLAPSPSRSTTSAPPA